MLYAEHVSVYAWEVEGKGVPSPCVGVCVCYGVQDKEVVFSYCEVSIL